MAFEEVADLSCDVTISLGGVNRKTNKKNPTSIEGYYLGSREVADKKKKSGVSFIYVFQTPEGNVGVWGKTDIDRKMGGVQPGTMTRISFDRMMPTQNGDMYKYKVAVDKSNTIEVNVGTASASSGSTSESYDGGDETEEYGSEDEDESEAYEAPPLRTSSGPTAAERQAKVQSLLGKNKSVSKN